MVIQACINGARRTDFHPKLPVTVDAMAREATACIAAGAAELHVHPRDGDARESLLAVNQTILALRSAVPGALVGVSTGAWIEDDEDKTRQAIEGWRERPDYASVNLSESDAPAVMTALRRAGVGIEAGLATASDAERFVALRGCREVFRILIEVDDQDFPTARRTAAQIASIHEDHLGHLRQLLPTGWLPPTLDGCSIGLPAG